MNKKIFAYVRKNLKSENIDEQIAKINKFCEDNNIKLEDRDFIVEDDSHILSTEGFKALSTYMIKSGDVLIITELDRLGRNAELISEEWSKFCSNNIELIITDNNTFTTYQKNPNEKQMINKIVYDVLAYIGEKEKIKNKRKQAKGIKALKDKNNGKGIGRPKTKITDEFKDQYKLWRSNKQTAVKTFNKLGLTKATFYRMVKEFEEENQ